MKTVLLLGLVATTALVTSSASADVKAACLDASSKAQTLRDAHKLVEAREQLRVCAAALCPSVVQSDCANWLADVEKALPSVVLVAKNGAGSDLADVTVSVDGQLLASKLDGQALPINAGPHTFHFERGDGSTLDRQVIIREGEKNQEVAAVLGAAAPVSPAPPPAATSAPDSSGLHPVEQQGSSSPLRTAGWVLGAAGVVGLGVGAVFGAVAMGEKSSADCNANNQCQPGPLSSARSAALGSDVGFIAGGVLLAAGAALVLLTPSANSANEKSTASLKVAPMVGTTGGGVVLGGSW